MLIGRVASGENSWVSTPFGICVQSAAKYRECASTTVGETATAAASRDIRR
jgi:hypothetical protein